MAGFGNTYENKLLDHVFGGATYTQVATLWVGLSTADPADDASGLAEPSGNGYARVAVVNSSNNWSAAASGVKRNASSLAFPTATGSWGLVTHQVVWDSPTSTGIANMVGAGALGVSINVTSGMLLVYGVGSLSISLD